MPTSDNYGKGLPLPPAHRPQRLYKVPEYLLELRAVCRKGGVHVTDSKDDRRSGRDRRSGIERRLAIDPRFIQVPEGLSAVDQERRRGRRIIDLRSGKDRRSGPDRRKSNLGKPN